MNYIVLDLEWNQAAYKSVEEEDLPFEIIEIGAVKMDQNTNILGEFQRLIRPQVYPFLVRRTKQLTGWKDKDLEEKGIYFEDACAEFLKWCGNDCMFLVWGGSDLTQLERNMAYFEIKIPWKYPLTYLDVQKLYALQEGEGKVRRSLDVVAERYELESDRPFHHAVDDAWYTAQIFKRIDRKKYEDYYSIDYYNIPRNRFEEKTFSFPTYTKYVSRQFNLKEEALNYRGARAFQCRVCGRRLKKLVPWFSDGRTYMALGECPVHGLMKGHIRLKIAERFQGYFVVRTVRSCTEEDADAIRAKKEGVQQKRKNRRKRTTEKKRAAREAEMAEREASGVPESAEKPKSSYRPKKRRKPAVKKTDEQA